MENLLFVDFSNNKYGLLTMILIRYKLGMFFLAILLGFGVLTKPAGAQPIACLKLDANRVPWTELSFSAKNFWVAVSSDIQLNPLSASELDAVLLKSPKGNPVEPQTAQAARMTIQTRIEPKFRAPINMSNRIWFNPRDGSALGRVRLRRGEDDFKKIYRFTDQGVFRHSMEPKHKTEASLKPEKWTKVKNRFYPFDLSQTACTSVSERSLLIFILSAFHLYDNREPLSLCVFGKRQLHQVVLQAHGTQPIKVDYVEKQRHKQIQKVETINALKIQITATPVNSSSNEVENFSFLGFHEDIFVYLNPTSRLPIQVRGIIPSIGEATLKLRQVTVK